MHFPEFYTTAPRLQVRDPLAEFLGAAEDGLLEYRYEDAVRLAGHSCPTVASAYVLACRAMSALYPDDVPVRGGVRVAFADDLRDGVTGVVASVLTLITGAAQEGGFKGIGGQFVRRTLQEFGGDLPLTMRVTRLDNGKAVDAGADLSSIPPHSDMAGMLGRSLRGEADAAERQTFGRLWQQRVGQILKRWHDDAVFSIQPVGDRD